MENIDATQVDKETPSITIHKDPKTQRRYSYNALTGETEWLTEVEQEENSSNNNREKEVQQEVTIHTDPKTQRRYSYNALSGETEWLTEVEQEENSSNNNREKEVQQEVTIHTDPKTQRRYSYNALSGETEWLTEVEQEENSSNNNREKEVQQEVTIHTDPKTQRRYSYNALTGETEWLTEAGKKILETNDVQTTLKELNDEIDIVIDDEYTEEEQQQGSKIAQSHGYFTKKLKYINFKDSLQILIVSWNVGNAHPNEDELYSLLNIRDKKPDMIVIGAQECTYNHSKASPTKSSDNTLNTQAINNSSPTESAPNRTNRGISFNAEDYFSKLTESCLDGEYELLTKVKLMEMRQLIYVRKEIIMHFSNIEKKVEATGLAHVVGNKGGLAIKLEYKGTSMVFLSCHLAAHMGHLPDRLSNLREIFRNLRLGNQDIEINSQFDYIFLFGDLNFRLDIDRISKAQNFPSSFCFDYVREQINQRNFKELFHYDQLHNAQKEDGNLTGFREGIYNFAPTFKVLKNNFSMEYNQKRIPSYCDRILWKSIHNDDDNMVNNVKRAKTSIHEDGNMGYTNSGNNSGGIKQILFESCENVTTSDHKPVRSLFQVNVFPKLKTIQTDDSAAEKDAFVVEIFGLHGNNLRAFDGDGTSDPYFRIHMSPGNAMDTAGFVEEDHEESDELNVKQAKPKKNIKKSKKMTTGGASKTYITTSICKNTLNPDWDNHTYMFQTRLSKLEDLERCHIVFVGYDWDAVGKHDKIGYCTFPLANCIAESHDSDGGNAKFSLQINKKGNKQKNDVDGICSSLSGVVRVTRINQYYEKLDLDRSGELHSTMGQKLHGWAALSGNVPSFRRKSTYSALRDFYGRDSRRESFGTTVNVTARTVKRVDSVYKLQDDVPCCPITENDAYYETFKLQTGCLDHIMTLREPMSYGGILCKKGSGNGIFGNKKFKKRYFVLEQKQDSAILKYYDNEDVFKKVGTATKRGEPINLNVYSVEAEESDSDLNFILRPRNKIDRIYYLRTLDEEAKVAWLTVLRRWVPYSPPSQTLS
eukprot:g3617.t1